MRGDTMKKRKILKIVVATLFGGLLVAVGMVCGVNSYVKNTVSAGISKIV